MKTSSPDRVDEHEQSVPASVKRLKTSCEADALSKPQQEAESSRLVHPCGVKPIGNYFEDATKGVVECRATGLGHLACLSDIQMLSLLNFLPAKVLSRLGECSRACYVFSRHDELWRTLVLEEMEGNFTAEATWRESYVTTKAPHSVKRQRTKPIKITGFYSDLLFQSFYCAAAPIESSWIAIETIDRRSASQMTVADFKTEYENPNRPVIITEAIHEWPAIGKWTDEHLIKICGDQTFSAGGFQLSMEKYLKYSRTLLDDQPLFIFDKEFVAKVPALEEDYDVPPYFQEDFFSLLGEQRPDYRWLIIGPKKSGSSFHIDPNATNAWNGVIRGAKKWIMFPPEVVPPGVHPSEDGGDVSTPVSLIEWFVTFYPQIKKMPAHLRPLEGICREGEIMFVPHGWWHLVLNLDESIAITQNFVCSGNVKSVVRFLQDKPDQVSGLLCDKRPLLAGMFRSCLEKTHAEQLVLVDQQLQEEYEKTHRKTKWELLLASSATTGDQNEGSEICESKSSSSSSNGFGFGFSFD